MNDILSRAHVILSSTPSCWQSLVDSVPEDLLARSPVSSEWSAIQCLQHMIDTERDVFPVRIQAFLDGTNFPAINPAAHKHAPDEKLNPAALISEFSALRKKTMKVLAKVTPKDLERTALHGELGKVTLKEMLNEIIGHDLMHIVQAERAVLQPFIAACGPWRKYFADHDVEMKGTPAK